MSRRDFVKAAGAVPLAASFPALPSEAKTTVGEWSDDGAGLPCYRYTGPVPFVSPSNKISADYLPADPFFLLGNYRLTLIAHVSGMLQILSGERAWGRLNQGPEVWGGDNRASLEANGTTAPLLGVGAAAARTADKLFGVGYAQYRYAPIAGLRVTRTISVLPSRAPGEGASAFLVSVLLRNEGGKPVEGMYREGFGARYAQLFARWDADKEVIHYDGDVTREGVTARCDFTAKEPRPLLFSQKGRMSRFEGAPPSLFLRLVSHVPGVEVAAETGERGEHTLGVHSSLKLAAGQEQVFQFVVGYAFAHAEIDPIVDAMTAAMDEWKPPQFQREWAHVVPAFAEEKDADLRREMRWNAGVLEQMATWREYYDETVVPQGTVYDYQWGNMASSRDLAQQALPFCHTNPAIARSTLRFIMKRTIPDGEIKLDDLGFGWAPHSGRLTSDQQLYFFLLLNEYLRATKDATILSETISYYPRECAGGGTGLDHVRSALLFLRDRVGTGRHGLVKLWNSDWNDMFFFWPTSEPYNYIFDSSESHMNTAMAIVILGDLAETLKRFDSSPESAEIVAAASQYRGELLKAFLADWGSAPFPRRMYFQNRAVGEDEMWLEPQGFTLLIPELSVERKRALFAELHSRLMNGEAMGPKQIERPVQKPGTPPGSRENGGFWYALTGPVVLGVAGFDREAAQTMLRQMTFANFSKHFPAYWTGQWSASDALDSSSLPTEGLSNNIPYCAHSHAWPLYLYLRLSEL